MPQLPERPRNWPTAELGLVAVREPHTGKWVRSYDILKQSCTRLRRHPHTRGTNHCSVGQFMGSVALQHESRFCQALARNLMIQ